MVDNHTERPFYADYDSPEKFKTIIEIIGTRLRQFPNAVCSYSGGSDSDILIDLVETARRLYNLSPVQYVFFNTGLEMDATKRHVKDVSVKYNVKIDEVRPKKNIVLATREFGVPFVSKVMSYALEVAQTRGVPFNIKDEYDSADNKRIKRIDLLVRYPYAEAAINFLCCCDANGQPRNNNQLVITSMKYMYDFINESPPTFKISAKCCDYCKKQPAKDYQERFDMVITGERKSEGGARTVRKCDANGEISFHQESNGKYRFKPLYYVSDKDKRWYKDFANIKYSDAYEVYGLKRTGCCGCSIASNAVQELKIIEPYEPIFVKAAWNIFGDSYRYRQQYEDYKLKRILKDEFGQSF